MTETAVLTLLWPRRAEDAANTLDWLARCMVIRRSAWPVLKKCPLLHFLFWPLSQNLGDESGALTSGSTAPPAEAHTAVLISSCVTAVWTSVKRSAAVNLQSECVVSSSSAVLDRTELAASQNAQPINSRARTAQSAMVRDDVIRELISGASAGAASVLVLQPLDVIKTRLQGTTFQRDLMCIS